MGEYVFRGQQALQLEELLRGESYCLLSQVEATWKGKRGPKPHQLHGLYNIARTGRDVERIIAFTRHQSQKAGASDPEFWQSAGKELSGLRQKAQELAAKLSPDLSQDRLALGEIYLRLVRDYVQHLRAELLYQQATSRWEVDR